MITDFASPYNGTSSQFINYSFEISSLITQAKAMKGFYSQDKQLDCYNKAFHLLCNSAIENFRDSNKLRCVIEPLLVKVLNEVVEFCEFCNKEDKLRDCANLMELSFLLQCRYLGFDFDAINSWQYAATLEGLADQLNADTFGRSLEIRFLCEKFSMGILQNRFTKFPEKKQMFLDTLKTLSSCYLTAPSRVPITKQFIQLHSELTNS